MGDQILHDRDEAWIGDGRLLPTKHLKRGSRLEMRDRHIGPTMAKILNNGQIPAVLKMGSGDPNLSAHGTRTEKRRVGEACVRSCKSRGPHCSSKKKQSTTHK